ncbi:hypothetical protein LCGC14_2718930 [marine sediment metagenome]|uniref:Uncharacterized protein n=1 Tax=marine sediment metagenome TaxID=412755 RepID=A0A0F9C2E5_9ZZZZ
MIYRLQFLSGFCASDSYLTAAKKLKIKSVEGLSGFDKHIISDIDDIINRPYADSFQALSQPHWRRANFDLVDKTGRITWAQIRIIDVDLHPVANVFTCLIQ